MKPKTIYLALCIAGFVLPYWQFVPWLIGHNSVAAFIPAMFANRISAFFVFDVVVSAAVLLVFLAMESRRVRVRHIWAPIVALLTVGVSLALPLFLYLRECALESARPSSDAARA